MRIKAKAAARRCAGRAARANVMIVAMAIAMAIAGCDAGAHRDDAAASGVPRIVSLAPSTTEMIFALGAGGEVEGVSQYCDYPPEVLKLPKVGTFLTPNIEAIAALRPTIVIGLATSSDLREVRALDAMDYTTLMVRDDSIAEIEAGIARIGARLGRREAAQAVIMRMRERIAGVERRLDGTAARPTLMVVGHQPMVAVGRGTFLDELLGLAHAANIADVADQQWPRLSLEYIIAARPQVILDGQMGTDPSVPSSFWAHYPSIPAVRDGRVRGYAQDPMLHPGPRIVDSLEILARLIHPEVFARADAAQASAGGASR
ncbi:MAG TPA: helical backbone metal receptor [Candidatus Binataceae bacterium]|nr:helical backbone metal receptor [Candidatus Binataceae bacterium]